MVYIILAFSSENKAIEFRRIIIDRDHRGVGQHAIAYMETYCKNKLNYQKIRLDVYEDNLKGIHIYEKLGYEKVNAIEVDGCQLLFYKKAI